MGILVDQQRYSIDVLLINKGENTTNNGVPRATVVIFCNTDVKRFRNSAYTAGDFAYTLKVGLNLRGF